MQAALPLASRSALPDDLVRHKPVSHLASGEFIPLDRYMAECNAHYYGACEAIGGSGDFITAPEISQMFGEMIGAWIISRWDQMGRPTPFQLIELGPGKGTLIADALRVLRSYPDIYGAVQIHLVETSPKLRAAQKEKLSAFQPTVNWHDDFNSVPAAPFILIANEFFDALPIQQFIYTMTGWQERGVIFRDDKIEWATQEIERDLPLPPHLRAPVPGNIIEHCPAMTGILMQLADRLQSHKGSALFIDYGYAVTDYGDTFQAVAEHEYADPLARPGEQDLTAHVNFNAIENLVRAAGLQVHGTIGQGEFLINVGLQIRAEKLIEKTADPADKMEIIEAAHRLTHPSEMGTLFKAICLASPQLPTPDGFHA